MNFSTLVINIISNNFLLLKISCHHAIVDILHLNQRARELYGEPNYMCILKLNTGKFGLIPIMRSTSDMRYVSFT